MQGPALPSPPQSALSHSPWQPCLRPQEASRASEGPPSPGRAGQMEARLRSNNHGNRRGVGKSWHLELASGTKGQRTAEPGGGTLPLQGKTTSLGFRGGIAIPRSSAVCAHGAGECARLPSKSLTWFSHLSALPTVKGQYSWY